MLKEWNSLSSSSILERNILSVLEGELSETKGLLREAVGGGLLTASGVLLLPGQQTSSEITGIYAGITYCMNKFKDLFKLAINPVKPFAHFDGHDVVLVHCGNAKDAYVTSRRGRAPWGTFREASWTTDKFFKDLMKPDAEVFKTPGGVYSYKIQDMLTNSDMALEAFVEFKGYFKDCLVRLKTTLSEIKRLRAVGYNSEDGLIQLTQSPGLISNAELLYVIDCLIFLNGLHLFMTGACDNDVFDVLVNFVYAQNSLSDAIVNDGKSILYRVEKMGSSIVKNGYKFAQCGFEDVNMAVLNLPHALWWVHEMLFQDRPVWGKGFEQGFFLFAAQRAGVFEKGGEA